MATGSTDSGENTVSDGEILPENPSTDGETAPEEPSVASLFFGTDRSGRSASKKNRPRDQFPVETTYICQRVRIGHLMLRVDDAEFVHAIQRGIEHARTNVQPPPTTTQELINEFLKEFEAHCDENGEFEPSALFGKLLGEFCYLVNRTKHLDFHLDLKPAIPWVF